MKGELSKHAAAVAVLFLAFLEGLHGCFDDDFSCLVGKFVLMLQEFLVGGFAGFERHFAVFCAPPAAARKLLFNERSKLAAAAFEAAFFLYLRTLGGDFAVLVGSFVMSCIPGGRPQKKKKSRKQLFSPSFH